RGRWPGRGRRAPRRRPQPLSEPWPPALYRPSPSPRRDTLAFRPAMETELAPNTSEDRSAYEGVLRYYELAKKAEWQVREMPWGEQPPIPEYKGSPQKL